MSRASPPADAGHTEPPPPRVIVVGAGIVGASIAWHLAARHGADVTVVATEVGGTATPNSFAWLNANRGNPRFYYDLRRRSLARWRQLSGGDGGDGGEGEVPGLRDLVRWTGTVQWDKPPDNLAQFIDNHRSWGYDIRRIDNADIALAEPGLVEQALPPWGWGVQIGEEGAVEPAAAAQLLLAHAQEVYGARVVPDTAVIRLLRDEGGRIQGVETTGGKELRADHVVLAAGVGAVALCAEAGVALPVTGRPGLLAHSKPVAKRLLNGLVISSGPHIRQTAEGSLVVGASFVGSDPGGTPAEARAAAEALVAEARGLFRPSDAALLELDYYTIGVRPQPRDGLPILGGVRGQAGLTLAVMHSGVTLAAIVGELLAEQVATGKTDAALEAFALCRFDDAAT